jgi:outer membrane protein
MNRRIPRRWLALCIAAGALCHAQEPLKKYWQSRFGGSEVQTHEVEGLKQHITDGKLHLQLRDFLALVLKNYTDIQVTRLDVFTQANQVLSAKAPFDPTLNLNFNTVRSVSPLSYAISGSPSGGQFQLPQTFSSLSQLSTIDYKQLLPTGQTFESTFNVYRSSGDFYAFPSLFGVLNFQLTQPLLQNRTNLQALTPLRVARTQLLITAKQSEATISDAVEQMGTQYWQAVLARENIRVNRQAATLAHKSYDRDKQALELGALSRLDIYQSETQLAERDRDVVQAEYQYRVLLDGLRRLIGADLTPELRSMDLVLDDDPSALPERAVVLPFEEALKKAMLSRPESEASKAALTLDDLNARAGRDALLPRLDLALQGGSSGPSYNPVGSGIPVGSTQIAPPPGLGATLQQVMQFTYPTYGFSVTATFPFRNSTAQATLADALVGRARDRYRQRQAQEQITLDVRQAIHSIELADATIQAAQRARDLAGKNVAAEQEKYQLGSVTAFELLDSQSRLANAESVLVTAYVSYQEAFIQYQHATSTLLDGFGMIVERPGGR